MAATTLVISNEIQINFQPAWPWNLTDDLQNDREPLPCSKGYLCHFIAIHEFKFELSSGNAQIGAKSSIFRPLWPRNMTDDIEKHHFKFCASFRRHLWLQALITVRKPSIRVKIVDFSVRVTYKVDGWPRKTIGCFFYATSIFVRHFVVIYDFKLELQSGNPQFGLKSSLFRPVWLKKLTNDLENNRTSFLCHFKYPAVDSN